MALHLTGDAEADKLLSDEPLALLVGMLLDTRTFSKDRVADGTIL